MAEDHGLLLHPTCQSHKVISELLSPHLHVPSEGMHGGETGFLSSASAMASASIATQVSLAQRDTGEDITDKVTENWCRACIFISSPSIFMGLFWIFFFSCA